MTTEAIAFYKSKLTEKGIIAVHISSRYLDLLGVLKVSALDIQLTARHLFDYSPNDPSTVSSNWVLLSKNEDIFKSQALVDLEPIPEETKAILWTDTYSALFPVVRLF